MAKALGKKPKKSATTRTPSKKTTKKVTKPLRAPKRAVAAPVAPPAPKVSPTERRALILSALEAAQATHWGTSVVTTSTVGGVELRVTNKPGAKPFWWLRTHGLSSVAGVELAMRVPQAKDEPQVPAVFFPVLERLIGLARERQLHVGQIVRWPKPFGETTETDLEAFAITLDPSFGELRTAHDFVPVLLAVGLTGDEAKLVREWSPQGLLEVLARVDPTLSTTLDRGSLLASPRARQAIEQRVEREGSSMGVLQAAVSELTGKDRFVWKLDADAADAIMSLLKGRIGHQRPFTVKADGADLEVTPGDVPAISFDGEKATLKLTQTVARAVRSTLKARPGTYTWDALPALTVEVVPTP